MKRNRADPRLPASVHAVAGFRARLLEEPNLRFPAPILTPDGQNDKQADSIDASDNRIDDERAYVRKEPKADDVACIDKQPDQIACDN